MKTILRKAITLIRGPVEPITEEPVLVIRHPVHIVASPFKTASTTVGKALLHLGVGETEMIFHGRLQRKYAPVFREINKTIDDEVSAKNWIAKNKKDVCRALADLTPQLARFDIYSDAPFGHTHLHPFARKAIAPKARFIWVNRPMDDWIDSVRRWEISHPKVYPQHVQWDSDPDARAATMRARWDRHYTQYQRLAASYPRHCLELAVDDLKDYRALADFYGVDVPEGPLRKHNVSEDD
jgi:hypothetical protein